MITFREALNTQIEELSVNNCKLGESGGLAIGEAIQFDNAAKRSSNIYRHLKYVYARNNQFKDETAKAIAEGIKIKTC